MTKRISQANTVVVPAVHAVGVDGKGVDAKPVVAPAEAEAAAAKVDAKAGEVPAAVVAEPVAALVAPAAMAMVAEPVAAQTTDTSTAAATATTTDDGSEGTDYTPYIVGGVLLAGGILAVALSSDDDDNTAAPTPTPTPTNAVTFSSATAATIAENAAATTTVIDVNAAAAATGGAITYTLGGTDAALFNIDAATGIVTLRTSANFEAKPSYSITVTATSAANGTTPSATATQTIAVTVTNVNEAPAFASATATATVVENTAAGVVFTAAATDPDASTTLIYSLGGADAALFTINSATGAVSLRAASDFETKPTYSFTVTASDAATGGLSATQTVTLNVTNVNEAPVFTSAATASIAENVAAGTAVYTSVATDPERATLTYSLGGTDAALFTINSTTGVVSIIASPDFETKATYTFTVNASDGTNTSARPVTLSITDIANEGPAATTVSLDTAAAVTVSGLGAAGAAQATNFTDAAGTASNATINNFGRDDTVTFTGTTSVSFSSIDNDLTIEFLSNGVLNKIQINDVVDPNNFNINSEASAEAAVNLQLGTTGVDYFRFA